MTTTSSQQPLSQELLAEIPVFENFLHNIGFKRNEGAIFGLLVLSEGALSSEEIENALELSQSAVSQALKKLALYGAIETRESRVPDSTKRIKYHQAKEDSLSIVSTLFRKREQETIKDFKLMAQRVHSLKEKDASKPGIVLGRMSSIITTCEMAEAVIQFVMELSNHSNSPLYQEMTTALPKMLQKTLSTFQQINENIDNNEHVKKFTHLLSEAVLPNLKEKLPHKVREGLKEGLREGLHKLSGDHYANK